MAETWLRHLRRIGESLKCSTSVGNPQWSRDATIALKDIGINKSQSSRWQALARIPESDFETFLKSYDGREDKQLTLEAALKLATFGKPMPEPSIEDGCTSSDLDDLASSGKKYATIYADPPWSYGNQATRAATGNHYQTMSLDDIAALPIADLAADEAHLHLWTTNAFLFDAKRIIESWGFEYKSCFVWCKTQMGIGNYWRVSHEFMLLGVRGGLTFQDRSQMSWMEASRGKHSSKPESVRSIIEKVSKPSRLELFARMEVPGWDCWGNEVSRNLLVVDK